MVSFGRWWNRHGLQLALILLVLGTVWLGRPAVAVLLRELYSRLVAPWQARPAVLEQLRDSRVLELEQRVSELQRQNQQLKTLVKYQRSLNLSTTSAPVIGRSPSHWWQQLLLAAGRAQGVGESGVVLAPGGVIGRVMSTTDHTSQVLLITDASSKVGVTLTRSRAMGILQGQGNDQPLLRFFDKDPNARVGDGVVTSTFSTVFPAGLPVGRIVSINWKATPAPEATVELYAPLDQVEWGVIQTYASTPRPEKLDQLGP